MIEQQRGTIVLQGGVDLYSIQNGGDAMKNQNNFDFKDLLTFGIFLLALLTFVFTFCKQLYIEKPPQNFDRVAGWNFYFTIRSTHLVGGCSFYMSNITCFSYFFKKKIFSITIPYSWKNHGNIHLAHFYYIQETLYLSAFQAFLFVKTFHRRELYCSLFKLVYVHIYVLILFLPTKLY